MKNFFQGMGVVNITPNSFSDGGLYNSSDHLKAKALFYLESGLSILDFGAESTAPFNDPISKAEEEKRIEDCLFPFLEKCSDKTFTLSIDTYRPSTFLYVYSFLKSNNLNLGLIWNDVSGIVDDKTISVLDECPGSSYILSHNRINTREQVLNHMEYSKDNYSVEEYISYFNDRLLILPSRKIYLDPCFGFSKTFEENIWLLKNLNNLVQSFSENQGWVFGISRKSFLQKIVKENPSSLLVKDQAEVLQTAYFSKLSSFIGHRELIIRIHEPSVINSLNYICDMFDS